MFGVRRGFCIFPAFWGHDSHSRRDDRNVATLMCLSFSRLCRNVHVTSPDRHLGVKVGTGVCPYESPNKSLLVAYLCPFASMSAHVFRCTGSESVGRLVVFEANDSLPMSIYVPT